MTCQLARRAVKALSAGQAARAGRGGRAKRVKRRRATLARLQALPQGVKLALPRQISQQAGSTGDDAECCERRHTTLARLLALPKGVKQKAEAAGVLEGAMRSITSALCGLQATLDQLWWASVSCRQRRVLTTMDALRLLEVCPSRLARAG